MKTNIIQLTAIAMMSAVAGFVSCVQDRIEPSPSELTTRGMDEKNAAVDFHYIRGEKRYFDIRKDRVIVKTASIDDAEKLSKQQDVFFSGEKAITVGR